MYRILHDGGSYRVLQDEAPGAVRYRIDGQVVEAGPADELNAAVDRMHASGLGRDRVELDLRHATYVDGTGLQALVRWVQLIGEATRLERYRLIVQPSFEHDWQRSSLRDWARYAGPERVELVGDAPAPPAAMTLPAEDEDSLSEESSTPGLQLGDRLK